MEEAEVFQMGNLRLLLQGTSAYRRMQAYTETQAHACISAVYRRTIKEGDRYEPLSG